DMFVYAFMRQEAVLSSQIEGTQASLEDVLEFEAGPDGRPRTDDLTEIVNYLNAMRWGLDQLPTLPVSLRLIKSLHAILLAEGRGAERAPGNFRSNQNWIGPPGCTIQEATYVPPPVPDMMAALHQWELFLHQAEDIPPLIKCALAHAQFETIHPFWDGNGRLGRMIVTFLLCSEEILASPVLYLSLYFRQFRERYYHLLQATRDDGNWEDWIIFFLRGVTATSKSALISAQKITRLHEELRERAPQISASSHAGSLIEQLFKRPYVDINLAARMINTTYPTASTLVRRFEAAGVLTPINDARRNRIYAFRPYLDILHEATDELTGVIEGDDYLASQAEQP
ncbi:MAG: Fic family protein, partial [Rhodospirillaceae bacterium]|nr:Fic family protein [Rhodospirillaceae bacterium]